MEKEHKHHHSEHKKEDKSKDKDGHSKEHKHHSHHSHKSQPDRTSKKTYGGVLSDTDIMREIKDGKIIVYPFHKASVKNCSYDISLGSTFFRANPKTDTLNPFAAEQVVNFWGPAQSAEKASKDEASRLGLKPGDQFIRLYPGETILAHTDEYIGGQFNITTKMQARSSMARCNLTVCRDAGQGDVGYINRWAMQVTNNNQCEVVLPIGAKVGQIVFYYCASPPTAPYVGKYQEGGDLESLVKNWKAEDLLPKAQLTTDIIKPSSSKQQVVAKISKPTSVLDQLAANNKLIVETD